MATYKDCLSVSAQCPVTATAYGYTPSLPANATLLAVFAVVLLAQSVQGVGWRTCGFTTAFVLGTSMEIIGYSGRLILHSNPWNQTGLVMELFCLTIGPVFYSAGLYLCYSHLVESFKPVNSRIPPQVYPLIAASTVTLPLILQATGSILTANSIRYDFDATIGTNLTIAGLVFQVFTIALFGILCFDFGIRAHLDRKFFDPSTEKVRSLQKFRYFWVALAYAYVMILIRCIYRAVVLAGSIRGRLAHNETAFIVLEGVMILIAAYALSLVHPGYAFKSSPEMNVRMASDDEKSVL